MRAATDQLRDIRAGEMVEELTEEMAKVVNAVLATGKKGSVTVKISFDPASKGDAVVTITDDIKSVIPREKKAGTLMFAQPSGSLQRQDPRQTELNLSAVPKPEASAPLAAVPATPAALKAAGSN
ncbi:hypothetical protein NK214_11985 [Chromobacterium sp. S0633]|uniref:hypothetical protein n=1 Tax=Chromobacterium sp. S0633 TaxID=2957805 RepID=UPI00209D3F30|nr:hypothetical protein [Chromobacterium sp. S0633]MCP1290909.1 hypothetical protein [Chromobacterium sp. S0633]